MSEEKKYSLIMHRPFTVLPSMTLSLFCDKGTSTMGLHFLLHLYTHTALLLACYLQMFHLLRLTIHLMHDYVKLSHFTTKSHFWQITLCRITSGNSQSSVNQTNSHVRYVKVLKRWKIIITVQKQGLVAKFWTLM